MTFSKPVAASREACPLEVVRLTIINQRDPDPVVGIGIGQGITAVPVSSTDKGISALATFNDVILAITGQEIIIIGPDNILDVENRTGPDRQGLS